MSILLLVASAEISKGGEGGEGGREGREGGREGREGREGGEVGDGGRERRRGREGGEGRSGTFMASHRSSPSLVPRPCSLGTRLTSALFCIPKTIESSGLGMRLDGRWFGNET